MPIRTEAEWLASCNPEAMLKYLKGKKRLPSLRVQRLFTLAICRYLWALLEEPCRAAVEVAERFADGLATEEELKKAHDVAMKRMRYRNSIQNVVLDSWENLQKFAMSKGAWKVTEGATRPGTPVPAKSAAAAAQLGISLLLNVETQNLVSKDIQDLGALLRDVVVNPFREVAIEKALHAWREGTIPRIAQGIYDERAFDRLPILADALIDAGCTDEEVLGHCQGKGPHVRGCWVVDRLRGVE